MKRLLSLRKLGFIGTVSVLLAILVTGVSWSALSCVEIDSSSSFNCKDAGGVDSTCATAKCSEGFTLTGGGGACSAGDRKIKSVVPSVREGTFSIMCERQGVRPQARAICCKIE